MKQINKRIYVVVAFNMDNENEKHIDEVFSDLKECLKYIQTQNEYWNEAHNRNPKTTNWQHYLVEKELRNKSFLY